MAGKFLQRSRHGTVWYFRRRIPDELRIALGHPYFVRSLHTEKRSEAVKLARQFAVRTDTLFGQLREIMGKNRETIRADYSLEISLDELGRKWAKATDIAAGEHVDAALAVAALQSHFDGVPLPSMPTPAPSKPFGMRFADAIEDYLSKIDVSIATKNTYRPLLNRAMKFFGEDADVRYLEKPQIQSYVTWVKKEDLPYNTKRVRISQVVTFVNWMRDSYTWGADISNRNLAPKKVTVDSKSRDAFTLKQMKALFDNAGRFRVKCPEKYWATVATAFLGCRITELAQINLDKDLFQHDEGFWYIRIAETREEETGGAGRVSTQSVKNLASWRMLPIHPALERHGFIDFLIDQRAIGPNRRPFQSKWKPEIIKDQHPGEGAEIMADTRLHWGRPAIMWGSQELRRLRKTEIFYDPEGKLAYYHSMRHTFSGVMVDEKVSFDIREAAIGHEYGGKDAETYSKIKSNPKASLEQAFLPGLVKIAALLEES